MQRVPELAGAIRLKHKSLCCSSLSLQLCQRCMWLPWTRCWGCIGLGKESEVLGCSRASPAVIFKTSRCLPDAASYACSTAVTCLSAPIAVKYMHRLPLEVNLHLGEKLFSMPLRCSHTKIQQRRMMLPSTSISTHAFEKCMHCECSCSADEAK